jgi:hypothetical protein
MSSDSSASDRGKLMRAAPPVCLVLGILLVITGLLT